MNIRTYLGYQGIKSGVYIRSTRVSTSGVRECDKYPGLRGCYKYRCDKYPGLREFCAFQGSKVVILTYSKWITLRILNGSYYVF